MAKILIAGCGYVGTALGEVLASKHEVFGIKRDISSLPSSITGISADLKSLVSYDLPKDIDYVFYTAAAKERSAKAYEDVYLHGLESMLKAASSTKKVFFTSSTSVYAQTDGSWVNESSQTEPTHYTGKIMLQAEKLLESSTTPTTSIRLGGIYGPERTRLLQMVQDGKTSLSNTPQYTNRIHVDDCAGILAHLLTTPSPQSLYLGVDSCPVEKNEVVTWLAEKLNAPKPGTKENNNEPLRSNKRCSNKRILETGYQFLYPTFREGYGKIISSLG